MEIIEVQFKAQRKEFYRNAKALYLRTGNYCVVQADRGEDMGQIISLTRAEPGEIEADMKEVLRHATDKDIEHLNEMRAKESEALKVCQQKVAEHKLPMKLVDVEYQFDGNKITFYFTSEGRIDFRELVKDLAGVFRTRIDLQADRRARRGAAVRRDGDVRAAPLLRDVPQGLRAGDPQDGEGPEPSAHAVQDLRGVRAAHVLSRLRARVLQGSHEGHPEDREQDTGLRRRAPHREGRHIQPDRHPERRGEEPGRGQARGSAGGAAQGARRREERQGTERRSRTRRTPAAAR